MARSWIAAVVGLTVLVAPAFGQALSAPQLPRAAPPLSDAAFAPIVAGLRSGDEQVRVRALWQIGNLNLTSQQAAEVLPLIRPLLRQWPSPPFAAGSLSVQTAALIALWGAGPEGTAALPEVIAALDFPEIGIRDSAMNAVARMRLRGADAARVIPAVVRLLDHRPSPEEVGQHAAAVEKALLWIAEAGPAAAPAVPALSRMLSGEATLEQLYRVLPAIGAIGPAGADAQPALIALLERNDLAQPYAYVTQAIALTGLHNARLRDQLLTLFERESSLRPAPALDPGIFGDEASNRLRHLNGMLGWIGPSDPEVTQAVVRAIARTPDSILTFSWMEGNGLHIGPLRPKSIGNLAENFIGALTPAHAAVAPELISLVRRSADRPNARRLAFRGLQRMAAVPDEFLPLLLQRVEEAGGSRLESEFWAYGVLESMGPRAAPAVAPLIAKVRDGNPSEKLGAARALAAIGRPAAMPALPEIERATAAAIEGGIASDWQLRMLECLVRLDPGSRYSAVEINRILAEAAGPDTALATDESAAWYIEAQRILLEHGPDPGPPRAALLRLTTTRDDRWAAKASGILISDRRSMATRLSAIDRAFRLLEPFVNVVTSKPPSARTEPDWKVLGDARETAFALESLLPGEAAAEPRLRALVRTLWEVERRATEPGRPEATNTAFLVLTRLLSQFEPKAPATQALLGEMRQDPNFFIREAAGGRVNDGRVLR